MGENPTGDGPQDPLPNDVNRRVERRSTVPLDVADDPSIIPTDSVERRSTLRWAFLLTLGLAAILLFPTIFWPFDYDQGTFAYGGSAILRGERPYIDFTDIKPPNIFYTYSVAFAIFGESVRAIRVFDYLNALLTIALLFLLALRLWKNEHWRTPAAIMASFAFITQYYIFGHWDTAQAETYSLPFLIAALLLVLSDRRSVLLRSALAGLCIAITFYYKFPNGLFLILIGTALWLKNRNDWPLIIKAKFSVFGGFLLGVGLQSLYLATNGELIPLWHTTFSSTANYVATNYSGSFTIFQNIKTGFGAVGAQLAGLAIGISVARVLMSKKMNRPQLTNTLLPIVGAFIALILVQIQNKGYTYHYAVLLPWADLLIGSALVRGMSPALARLPRTYYIALLATASCLLFVGSYMSSPALHQRSAELYRIFGHEQPANGYITGDTLSNYVIANTLPSDRIFIFGFQPYVYWKSGRRPATKDLNTIHFKPSYVNPADRDELVRTLCGNPPALFLVETEDHYTSQGSTNDDSRTTIKLRYPELESLLAERYYPRDTIQHTIAYKLRN